jgi:hypothetical protein
VRTVHRHGDDAPRASNLECFHFTDDTEGMGFNPHRKRVKRASDVVIVASAMVAIALLVAWAFLG